MRAFYLRPDEDEVPLLEAAVGPCREAGVDLRWGDALEPRGPGGAGAGLEVLITRFPTDDELDELAGRGLQALVVPFAGPTETTKALMRERPALTLHNCHFNAAPTAELAVALLLSAVKRVGEFDAKMRRQAHENVIWSAGWDLPETNVMKLEGRTAVVLGYGALGSRVAATLGALGMQVHAVRRSAPAGGQADGVATVHGLADLPGLLPRADVLMVCLPGTAATFGLLGQAELSKLPKGAVLVNVGRGSVVDEQALYAALRDGHLGGAALDVWFNYPMIPGQYMGSSTSPYWPGNLPFHELPTVVMSPHRGQSSDTKASDRIQEIVKLLVTRARTGVMPNRFDLDAEY